MTYISRPGKEERSLTHTDLRCVGCGICSEICPTSSIKLGPIVPIARGLLKVDKINIDKDNCCLCGLCASACPFDAMEFDIENVNAKSKIEYPKWNHAAYINEDECIYCGRCQKACPPNAIYLFRSLPDVKDLVRGEAEINQDKCIQCGMCEEMCPAEAVNMHRNQINSSNQSIASSVDIDESKCIYCGICKKICPEEAIKIVCTTCMSHEEIKIPEIEGKIILNQEECIKCGWCQEICPVDAAQVSKPFEGELVYDADYTCKGKTCHACEDVCPCNAISIVEGKSKVNPNFCVLCGACAQACPQEGIQIKREKINLENVRSKSWQKILAQLTEEPA
jgi:4Fe-4S ferredoxin